MAGLFDQDYLSAAQLRQENACWDISFFPNSLVLTNSDLCVICMDDHID